MVLAGQKEEGWEVYTFPQEPEYLPIIHLSFLALSRFHWTLDCKIELRLFVVGGSDLHRCGCDLHGGGVGAAGLGPEEAVPGCDAGELPESGLSG